MSSNRTNESVEGDLASEIATCTKAISSNPSDAKAYRQRGLFYARRCRYDDALKDFGRALTLVPNDAHAYGLRALVWAKLGNRDRALEDFEVAIRLAPEHAELYRSHRDRVLAEHSAHSSITGGNFSILTNPFVLLGLPATAGPVNVKEAYEDAVEDDLDDPGVLLRAQQTLLTPRLRIEAELGGFLDVDAGLAAQIISDIRSGASLEQIRGYLHKLHSLPRSNVMAHFGAVVPLGLHDLSGLIEAQSAISPGAVCDAINEVREEICLGSVDAESVGEALFKLIGRQTKAVVDRIAIEERAAERFNHFVSRAIAKADSSILFRLDDYVRTFVLAIAPQLSKLADIVSSACEEIKTAPLAEAPRKRLETSLRSWISLLHPIQTYETSRHREDTATREMYEKVRNLALWLANEQKEFASAETIVAIAREVFNHLPRAAQQMMEDSAQLADLRNEQLAVELLTPLLQLCEEIKSSHRIVEMELLRNGFSSKSVGSVKTLYERFVSAVRSTAGMPFSDGPWRLARGVAISLNNESSAPRAAEILVQGLLEFSAQIPPTTEMIDALRADKRIVRKNLIEADLGKCIASQKWTEAERLADELRTVETDKENLEALGTIHANIVSKRKAAVRTRWFWAAAAAGLVIWIAIGSQESKPRSADYRASPSSSSASWRQLAIPSSTSPSQSSSSASLQDLGMRSDNSETVPSTGSGLSFSRSDIRYCQYQDVRLEAARAVIASDFQTRRFNADVEDFNSRCGSYRYRQSDKDAVESEVRGKRTALELEGRRLAASWR